MKKAFYIFLGILCLLLLFLYLGWWKFPGYGFKATLVFLCYLIIHPFIMMRRRWRYSKKTAYLYLTLGLLYIVYFVGVPNFIGYTCRAKQSEAKAQLEIIFDLQKEYFHENNKYAQTVEELSYVSKDKHRSGSSYDYSLDKASAAGVDIDIPEEGFIAVASGADIEWSNGFGKSEDVWIIDHRKRLINVFNDCTKKSVDPNKILKMSDYEFAKFEKIQSAKDEFSFVALFAPFILFNIAEPIVSRRKRRT